MRSYLKPGRLQRFLQRIKRFLTEPDAESESPEDPYAYVGAPKKPRPPHRSAAAAEPLD
jgi:hypothetical protein